MQTVDTVEISLDGQKSGNEVYSSWTAYILFHIYLHTTLGVQNKDVYEHMHCGVVENN